MSKSIAKKISQICGNINKIEQDGKNAHSGYQYISYEQLNAVLRPQLAHHGLAFYPDITSYEERDYTSTGGKTTIRTVVKGSIVIVDSETGERESFGFVGADQDTGGKSMSQAITEGIKRAMFKLFFVSSKSDIDPDSKTTEVPQKHFKGAIEAKPEPKTEYSEIHKQIFTECKRLGAEKMKEVKQMVEQALGKEISKVSALSDEDSKKVVIELAKKQVHLETPECVK